MMVAFLVLLLMCLDGSATLSWFVVFAPLWVSDSITLVNSAHELWRVWRARPEAFVSRRNALIAQVNRLKGSVGVAAFKFLLAMRQVRNRPPRRVPRGKERRGLARGGERERGGRRCGSLRGRREQGRRR